MAYRRRSFRGIRVGTGYARAAVATKSKRLTLRQKAIKAKAKRMRVYKRKPYSTYKRNPLSVNVPDRGSQIDGAGVDNTHTKVYCPLTKGKPNRLPYLKKLVIANENKTCLRYSNIRKFENVDVAPSYPVSSEVGGGAYWMYYWNNGTAGGNVLTVPLYLFDVTSVNNLKSSTAARYNPAWRLRLQTANDPYTIAWEHVGNQDGSGNELIGSSGWLNEDASTTSQVGVTGQVPGRRCMLDWVHAKLLCYGAGKRTTRWKISFVQFTEDWLHPEFQYSGTTLPSSTVYPYQSAAAQFWSAYVASCTGNPIETQIGYDPKKIKVLKEFNFTMQPQTTIETDASVGHSKAMDIFMPMNRVCTYDWDLHKTVGTNELAAGNFAQRLGDFNQTVHPRARIYMMVTADSKTFTDVNLGTVPTVDYTPSFDLNLRKRITVLGS